MKKQLVMLSLLVSVLGYSQEENKEKQQSTEKQIKEVTITKTKKAVEQKADRTIFDFSEQPHLNTGNVLDGVKKLPGLMVSDLIGMSYQGKPLDVYMDGRPLNITSNELNAFLEGVPASSIDRVEVITNPGAEFPATSGGAILNIITTKSAKKYLTATYTGDYSFSNDEKLRHKFSNSILLNAKNKLFSWQLNVGQNYRENKFANAMHIYKLTSDNTDRGYFGKAAVTFDLGLDRLILNYDWNHNNNDALINGIATGVYESDDATKSKRTRHEAVATYQKRFDDPAKKLDFRFTYTNRENDFRQDNLFLNKIPTNTFTENSSNSHNANFKVDYSQDLNLFDKGKISIGGLYETLNFNTHNQGINNLEYKRHTASSYVELNTTIGKFDFTLGTRAENYDISGVTYNYTTSQYDKLKSFNQYRLFPNAGIQYNFVKGVYLALNYNKKISLPSISELNPNNNLYNGSGFNVSGNANIQPTIYDHFQAKISAMDFFFIGYNHNIINNEVVQKTSWDSGVLVHKSENLASLKEHKIDIGIPIPFAIFHKPIKEIQRTNPDKMSFMYLYAMYQIQQIPDFKSNAFWVFNVSSQIILPKDIKLSANYTYIPAKGTYYYYELAKPLNNTLNITLSKKFLKDHLNVSLYANDIFNTERGRFVTKVIQPNVNVDFKRDSRTFGISINYKLPSKNKPTEEAPNMLNQNKDEEANKGGFIR